jgi:hypothetical protein
MARSNREWGHDAQISSILLIFPCVNRRAQATPPPPRLSWREPPAGAVPLKAGIPDRPKMHLGRADWESELRPAFAGPIAFEHTSGSAAHEVFAALFVDDGCYRTAVLCERTGVCYFKIDNQVGGHEDQYPALSARRGDVSVHGRSHPTEMEEIRLLPSGRGVYLMNLAALGRKLSSRPKSERRAKVREGEPSNRPQLGRRSRTWRRGYSNPSPSSFSPKPPSSSPTGPSSVRRSLACACVPLGQSSLVVPAVSPVFPAPRWRG